MSNILIVNKLTQAGFKRTEHDITTPLVVHAVAGGGKSSLLKLLTPHFRVGTAAPANLYSFGGDHFVPVAAGCQIVDEYQSARTLPESAIALVGDPLQDPLCSHSLKPHYIKYQSHRVGPEVAAALKFIPIIPAGQSRLQLSSAYEKDPEGLVISYEPSVCDILRRHQVEHKHPNEVRSEEYPTVTVYTTSTVIPPSDHSNFYVALTRATAKILWLTLDATDPGHPAADL
ncbi:MAG: 25 kDa triple gene block protein 1 [Plant associated potexvirus 1]|nr:MAG: 25 kDa triple gene block protein 1 [Plant associated potexvirus 1]